MATIRPLTLAQTQPLRSEVLRDGRAQGVSVPTDDLPETFHLGAVENGEIVGTSTYFPAVCPHQPEVNNAYMLRFMAVSPAYQGQGIGASLINRAVELLRERGVELLWANARDTALRFYLDHGFNEIPGSSFVHESSGMPHTVVVRRIEE
jgi:GNAT superfamily N-acetyltransferase